MQVIILSGGKGTRLRPYTYIIPKPLMPIGEYPILDIVIKQLKQSGFEDIVLAVGYLKELIMSYFQEGKKWGVNIKYSSEDTPLGTAAPLTLIDPLEDNFLVMNGDILTDLDYKIFYDYHLNNGATCTIASFIKPVKIDLGVLKLDNNVLVDYIEKPILEYPVSMGIYAFKKEVLKYIPEKTYLDFPDLVKILLANNEKVICYPFKGHWLDIGRHEDFEQANTDFEKLKHLFLRT